MPTIISPYEKLHELDREVQRLTASLDIFGARNQVVGGGDAHIRHDIAREKLAIKRDVAFKAYKLLLREVAQNELNEEGEKQSYEDRKAAAKLGGLSRQDVAMQDMARRNYEERGI